LDKDLDIDAFWGDLSPPPPKYASLAHLMQWVNSEEPLLDLTPPHYSNLLPHIQKLPSVIQWSMGQGSLLSGVIEELSWSHRSQTFGDRQWSVVGGFVGDSNCDVPVEIRQLPKLYSLVMEVKFCAEETLPPTDQFAALQALDQHLYSAPNEALVFYRWCHLNDYAPRTIIVFDAYDRASEDENADVARILHHAGPALGVIRGFTS